MMDALEGSILNKNFEVVHTIDTYISFIWSDRGCSAGDFEVYAGLDLALMEKAQHGYYVVIPQSKHAMIIDTCGMVTDIEGGNKFKIIGQSLEMILSNYIVWTQTNLVGNFQDMIKKLLDDAIINPTDPDRKLSNFKFAASTDPRITYLRIDAQYTGQNLYSVIQTLCQERNLGFQMILTEANEFEFSLFVGADRSYQQTANPYVVFSPKFENVLSSTYVESSRAKKTVALVAGEGEGKARKTQVVGGGSGIDRREIFVDARDLSTTGENRTLSNNEYNTLLQQRGRETMSKAENRFIRAFEAEVETTRMFVYGRDYNIMDTVQFANGYGAEAGARVEEVIYSSDSSGARIIPTFSIVSLPEFPTKTFLFLDGDEMVAKTGGWQGRANGTPGYTAYAPTLVRGEVSPAPGGIPVLKSNLAYSTASSRRGVCETVLDIDLTLANAIHADIAYAQVATTPRTIYLCVYTKSVGATLVMVASVPVVVAETKSDFHVVLDVSGISGLYTVGFMQETNTATASNVRFSRVWIE